MPLAPGQTPPQMVSVPSLPLPDELTDLARPPSGADLSPAFERIMAALAAVHLTCMGGSTQLSAFLTALADLEQRIREYQPGLSDPNAPRASGQVRGLAATVDGIRQLVSSTNPGRVSVPNTRATLLSRAGERRLRSAAQAAQEPPWIVRAMGLLGSIVSIGDAGASIDLTAVANEVGDSMAERSGGHGRQAATHRSQARRDLELDLGIHQPVVQAHGPNPNQQLRSISALPQRPPAATAASAGTFAEAGQSLWSPPNTDLQWPWWIDGPHLVLKVPGMRQWRTTHVSTRSNDEQLYDLWYYHVRFKCTCSSCTPK